MDKKIFITEKDMDRLRELILVARTFGDKEEKYLKQLEGELNRAEIVPSTEIPADVITMNTQVRLRHLDTDEETVYRLSFPANADMKEGNLSILAPIGTALLGCRLGEIVEWEVPAGKARLKIEKILYQPEAAGDFHL